MGLADDLARLAALRASGDLSEAEFQAAKARLVHPTPASGALRRSRTDRWIGGVCGGLARYVGVESWIIRLLAVVLFCFGGLGLFPYVLLWIFTPSEP